MPASGSDSLVIRRAESPVFPVLDQPDRCAAAGNKLICNHLRRTVIRTVIDHDDFKLDTTLRLKRLQACVQ
jgi:hypothetical protein